MLIGIDHLVVAVDDPDAAAGRLEREVGLRATGGGRHETLGTHNRLVWLGDTYLELIGVRDERLAADSWIGRPTVEALRRGGALATYALASDDLGADLARLRGLGAHWDGPIAGERRRSDGRLVRWSIGVPPRLGPEEPPFVIEHDADAAEWTPDERAARAEAVHPLGAAVRLESLELPVASVAQVRQAYVRSNGLLFRPSLVGGGVREANVGRQAIRLRPLVTAAARASSMLPPPMVGLRAAGAGSTVVEALGLRFAING